MSEPLRSEDFPATVPATIAGTGARRMGAGSIRPPATTGTRVGAGPRAAKPATKAAGARPAPAVRPPSPAKGSRAQSTRARAKAQAREAKPARHAPKAVHGSAALAAKVDPLTPDDGREAKQRHLEVVGERRRRRIARQHRARLLLGLGATAAVVVAFALVYLHVIAAQRQFTLDDLNAKVTQEEATYQRLQLQVAQLNAPGRIVSVAESKLGMEQPSSVTELTPTEATPTTTAPPPNQAPAGDADWPQIKALIAGTP